MDKKGFTLAELLITLGIIGVAAALVSPILANLMPNKDKLPVLQAYNAINEVTQNILSDPAIYYSKPNSADYTQPDCIGLGCTHAPFVAGLTSYSGTSKYSSLLNYYLSLNDVTYSVSSTEGSVQTKGRDGTIASRKTLTSKITLTVNTGGSSTSFKVDVDTYGVVSPDPEDYLLRAYLENQFNMNNKKKDLERAEELRKGSISTPGDNNDDQSSG